MTRARRALLVAGAVVVAAGGSVAGVTLTGGSDATKGIVGGAITNSCHDVPGKVWGGKWHWSPAILRPTRIETYCVTYPPTGTASTLVKVTYAPAP